MAQALITRRGGMNWAGFTRVASLSGSASINATTKLQLNTTGTFLIHVECIASDYSSSWYGAGFEMDVFFFVVENGKIVHRRGFNAYSGYMFDESGYSEKTAETLGTVATIDGTGLLTITPGVDDYLDQETRQYYTVYQL